MVVAGSTSYRILQLVLLVAAVCALLLVSQSAPFRVGQFTSVFIIAIAIAGLNIVSGYTGLLSIGHSAFFGLGAYTTGVLIVDRGYSPLTTIPMAVVLCFVLGLLVGLPSLRIKGLYLALVTLAVAVAFPEVIRKTGDLTGGAAGMVVRANLLVPPKWTGLTRADTYLWIFWVSVVTLAVVMLLIRNLVKSRFGLAMVAVRDNEIAASANGINVARVKILAFGLSGAITGLAGSLFTMYIGALSPESFSLMKSIEFITGLVLGGIATQFGPIVGATAVVFLPYYTGSVTDGPVSGVVFGAVLIAIVFLMPDGIVGRINSVLRRFVLVVPADHPKYRKVNPAPERRLPRPLSFLSTHSKELDDMKRQTTIPAVIAAAALLLSACGGNSDAESNTSTSAGAVSVDDCSDPSGAAAPITDKLTVGWSGPTSGPLADAVGNVIEGMRARFEVENAAGGVGGVKLDVVVKDDAFSPERAKANVGEFIQKDKVDVLARSEQAS